MNGPFYLSGGGTMTGPELPDTPTLHRSRDAGKFVACLNAAYAAGVASVQQPAPDPLDLLRRLRIAEAQVAAARLWWEKSDGEGSVIEWMEQAAKDAEKGN